MTNSQRFLFAILFIVVTLLLLKRWRRLSLPILLLYLLAVIVVVFLIRNPYRRATWSLVPLKALKRTFIVNGEFVFSFHRVRYLKSAFLNVLLFVPFGYLLPMIWKKVDHWWKVLLLGLATSFGIELLQLVTRFGIFDVDDLINNITGAGIGWICWKNLLMEKD